MFLFPEVCFDVYLFGYLLVFIIGACSYVFHTPSAQLHPVPGIAHALQQNALPEVPSGGICAPGIPVLSGSGCILIICQSFPLGCQGVLVKGVIHFKTHTLTEWG